MRNGQDWQKKKMVCGKERDYGDYKKSLNCDICGNPNNLTVHEEPTLHYINNNDSQIPQNFYTLCSICHRLRHSDQSKNIIKQILSRITEYGKEKEN